jgi:hypothetical protein
MPTARRFAFLVLAGFALVAAGCSGNKDKIVGKWKVESSPGGMDVAQVFGGKAYLFMNFAKDGTMTMGLEFTDPAEKEKMSKMGDMPFPSAKYTVNGDTLEVKPADDKGKDSPLKGDNTAKIKFDGNDKLTLTTKDGDLKLSRMK